VSLFWKHDEGSDRQGLGEQADSEFSLTRYAPMARLLSHDDVEFLKTQPGYTPEIGRRFVQQRRQMLRLYLRQLTADFERLHERARVIAASLPADESALVASLMRQQLRFWYEMTALRLSLSLAWTGIRSVVVSGLVNAVAAMQAEVSRMSAPSLA
jgi:hypothetical protein